MRVLSTPRRLWVSLVLFFVHMCQLGKLIFERFKRTLLNCTELTTLKIGVAAELVEKSPSSLHIILKRAQLSIVQATLGVSIEAPHATVEYAAICNSI